MKNRLYQAFKLTEHPLSIDNEQEHKQTKDEIYQRLCQSISKQKPNNNKIISMIWSVRYKAAAILIGISMLLFIGYKYYSNGNNKTNYITLQAPKGQVLEVLLPDSSKITLNAASSIRYPSKFINTRDVYIEEGEAYFDVKHNASKPFIVHTGTVSTRVLGTAFNIKSYKKLPNITITVTRGRVQVDESSKTLNVLTPDHQLTFNKTDHKAITQKVNSANSISWTHGDFNLDGVYFNEIMLAIANRFKVEMIYDPKVFSNCENSIRFTKKQSLADVLKVLKTIQPIKYTIKRDSVFITGTPCL